MTKYEYNTIYLPLNKIFLRKFIIVINNITQFFDIHNTMLNSISIMIKYVLLMFYFNNKKTKQQLR